jgi:antirestriction protein ArdC
VDAAIGHSGDQGAVRSAAQRVDAAQIFRDQVLMLWSAVIECGFSGQSWLTFRQALGLGGQVRKSEQGTTVAYANRFTQD